MGWCPSGPLTSQRVWGIWVLLGKHLELSFEQKKILTKFAPFLGVLAFLATSTQFSTFESLLRVCCREEKALLIEKKNFEFRKIFQHNMAK